VSYGFDVLGREVPKSYPLTLGDHFVFVSLRADYIVAKNNRRYVAEVKSGRLAPRIENPTTRRQLLEYRLAFDVEGVLLVDVEGGTVREVEFPWVPSDREGRAVSTLAQPLAPSTTPLTAAVRFQPVARVDQGARAAAAARAARRAAKAGRRGVGVPAQMAGTRAWVLVG
jgi:hypothetical protein